MENLKDLIRETTQDPSPIVKAANYLAAALGVGTFLQLVNLGVGVLSACWLAVQLWGYIRYELPRKRMTLARDILEFKRDHPESTHDQ